MQTTSRILSLAEQSIARCKKLASFSEDAGGTRRTFLSAPMRDCHREIAEWLRPLGVPVQIDAAGNLRAIYPAAKPEAARLLVGSHLDTVPNAGAYDGILGVVLAVALLEGLDGRALPYGIEIVGFSEEEGVRFGTPFIGSRALVGTVDTELLARTDSQGVSVRRAIEDFGLNPAEMGLAALKNDILGYLEFHIEQGPVLERNGLPVGLVDAIAGQSRLEFIFTGRTNHAGTTPMDQRYDAVAGAAEWISAVERLARGVSGLVATVGMVEAKPGVANVIAGEVHMGLDVRHGANDVRIRAVEDLIRQAEEIGQKRDLTVRYETKLNQNAVAMDPFLCRQIEEAIQRVGCKPHRMVSGAGHDAMILAERVPAAMILLRTPGGFSHDPEESVGVEDVAKAIECGLQLLDQLALSPAFHTRTDRA